MDSFSCYTAASNDVSGEHIGQFCRREIETTKMAGVCFGICITGTLQGMFVSFVVRGSTAWKIGLQIGDRIEAIGDLYFWESSVTAAQAVQLLKDESHIKITVCEMPMANAYVLSKDVKLSIYQRMAAANRSQRALKLNSTLSQSRSDITTEESIVAVDGCAVLGMSDTDIQIHLSKALASQLNVSVLCMPKKFVGVLKQQWGNYNPCHQTTMICIDDVLTRTIQSSGVLV